MCVRYGDLPRFSTAKFRNLSREPCFLFAERIRRNGSSRIVAAFNHSGSGRVAAEFNRNSSSRVAAAFHSPARKRWERRHNRTEAASADGTAEPALPLTATSRKVQTGFDFTAGLSKPMVCQHILSNFVE